RWMNEDANAGITEAHSLMIEFSGSDEQTVARSMSMAQEVCEEVGSFGMHGGMGRDMRSRLWEFRHGLRERLVRTFPGEDWVLVDLAVPISNFPALAAYCQEKIYEYGFDGRVIGHAGDGNMHAGLHFSPNDHAKREKAVELGKVMVAKALELEGTCTGEHGIGVGKQKYMAAEHGETALNVMRTIKQALDPQNILNPGKVLPS
ncbi:MAG: FAD-linked oxidase C-terminal domain-containing protein, partial [Chloroflexota bacterium]